MFKRVLNAPLHYSRTFFCFKNVPTNAYGCLFGWDLIPVNIVYEIKLLNQVYYSCLTGSLKHTKTVICILTTISKVVVFINKIDLNILLGDEHLIVNWSYLLFPKTGQFFPSFIYCGCQDPWLTLGYIFLDLNLSFCFLSNVFYILFFVHCTEIL